MRAPQWDGARLALSGTERGPHASLGGSSPRLATCPRPFVHHPGTLGRRGLRRPPPPITCTWRVGLCIARGGGRGRACRRRGVGRDAPPQPPPGSSRREYEDPLRPFSRPYRSRCRRRRRLIRGRPRRTFSLLHVRRQPVWQFRPLRPPRSRCRRRRRCGPRWVLRPSRGMAENGGRQPPRRSLGMRLAWPTTGTFRPRFSLPSRR